MTKKISIIVLVVLIVGGILHAVTIYNSLVSKDESVKTAWGQVQNQYQRRNDLIPNLVNTVKGYATHEKETLEAVVEARAKATQSTVDAENLTPEMLASFQKAQGELSLALGRLMAVIEKYPDLKANENFLMLQAQLEGTENRIAIERKRFNEASMHYNKSRRRFPNILFASMLGFDSRSYFEAGEEADKAVDVDFK